MNFTEKITQTFHTLSDAQKKVAHYMLENTQEIVVHTAQKVAEASNVSEATVHRLSKALGYESFFEMKQDIHQFVKNDHRAVNNFITKTAMKQESWLEEHFLQEADNIIQTSQGIQKDRIHLAARYFLDADHIWVAGWRMGISVTSYMQFVLKYMLGKSQMIPQGEAAEYVTYLKKGDVLFVTSLPRYCQKTLTIAKIAKEKEVQIIAITDSQIAPICEYADIVFLVKSKSKSFLDSYTSAVSVCNAIVNEIAYIGKDDVMDNIKEMETKFEIFHDRH
nr:MurR/RpiR family transcriptional regulator [Psychrobacillus vulpis]